MNPAHRSFLATLAVLLLLGLQACQDERAQRIAHAPRIGLYLADYRGDTLQLPRPPERMALLSPPAESALEQWQAGKRIVASTTRPPELSLPASTEAWPSLRAALATHQPDLIIADASHYLQPQALRSYLDSLAPVLLVDFGGYQAGRRSLQTLGRLAARPQQADSLAQGQQQVVQGLRATTSTLTAYPTLCLIDGSQATPLIPGDSTHLAQRLRDAGAAPLTTAKQAYAPLQIDSALAYKPEYVVVISSNQQALSTWVQRIPNLKRTPALLNGNAFQLGPGSLRWGPKAHLTLLQLAQMLHPAVPADSLHQAALGTNRPLP